MKILIYGLNYSPELTGVGKYSGEMAEWLAGRGHEVRVVVAPPYYPEWKVADGYASTWYAKEQINGVGVWRCPLFVPAVPRGKNRLVHLASFALSSLPVMLRQAFWRPDMIVVIEPPLFCAPAAWLAARLSGAKCWLHIQDFEVDAAFDLGIVHHGWMKRSVLAAERWMMRRFDAVSTISKAMLWRLGEKGMLDAVLFPNWADINWMGVDQAGRETFRRDLGIGAEQCLCLYSGNISIKQGMDILPDVAAQLPAIRFVICGDGVRRNALQAQAERLGLSNMTFLQLQSLEHFPVMLSAADIHLVIQKCGAADLVMPSKLTNILAVGGVAIATAEAGSELGLLGEGADACLYRCEPESIDALAGAISTINADKDLATKLGINAKAYADKHILMDQVLEQFERILKQMTEPGG